MQNNQISGGQLGGMPQAADQQLNASIIVQTRLQTPEEFGKILLKVQQDGSQVLSCAICRPRRTWSGRLFHRGAL
ncbi:efflux RND transporter permease subunit [Escherichia coli]